MFIVVHQSTFSSNCLRMCALSLPPHIFGLIPRFPHRNPTSRWEAPLNSTHILRSTKLGTSGADRGNGQQPKGQNFGGKPPPKVCSVGCSFGGGIRPREAVPRFGDHLPAPLHRHGSRWERELGENDSGRVPPRVVIRHFSSLFTAHRRFCR